MWVCLISDYYTNSMGTNWGRVNPPSLFIVLLIPSFQLSRSSSCLVQRSPLLPSIPCMMGRGDGGLLWMIMTIIIILITIGPDDDM